MSIDAHEERTRAKVQPSWRGNELVGVGLAHLNPDDEPVVEIGDELAVALASSDLANQLFALTASDIEALHRQAGDGSASCRQATLLQYVYASRDVAALLAVAFWGDVLPAGDLRGTDLRGVAAGDAAGIWRSAGRSVRPQRVGR